MHILKKFLIGSVMIALSVTSLSGCTSTPDSVSQKIIEHSDILSDADYQNAIELQTAGKLNDTNYYKSPDHSPIKNIPATGTVEISFASNSYLDLEYYTDSELRSQITSVPCYLNPGDSVYAVVAQNNNPNSNLYQLDGFQVYEYDESGDLIFEDYFPRNSSSLIFEIPETSSNHTFSIMPFGSYPDRKLSMSVYFKDDDGKPQPLESAGTWSINDEPCERNEDSISSVEPYVLKFQYDTKNYFYVDSVPECFTRDPLSSGFVEFWEAEANEEDVSYQIELRKYLNLSLETTENAKVSVNHSESVPLKKGHLWESDHLKYGDTIIIETDGSCIVTNGDYQYLSAAKDPIGSGFRYTLRINDERQDNAAEDLIECISVNRIFNVTLIPELAHCECEFELDGHPVSGVTKVQEGQKLTVSCKIIDSDYVFDDPAEGFWQSRISPKKREIVIPISPDLDGQQITAGAYFTVVEKEDSKK